VQVCGKQGVADEIVCGAELARFGEKIGGGKTLDGYLLRSGCIQRSSIDPSSRSPQNRRVTRKAKKKMKKADKHRVQAIPPTEPAARDEGPRLIPLRSDPAEDVPMSHYL
jgi:hypothetical protein